MMKNNKSERKQRVGNCIHSLYTLPTFQPNQFPFLWHESGESNKKERKILLWEKKISSNEAMQKYNKKIKRLVQKVEKKR